LLLTNNLYLEWMLPNIVWTKTDFKYSIISMYSVARLTQLEATKQNNNETRKER